MNTEDHDDLYYAKKLVPILMKRPELLVPYVQDIEDQLFGELIEKGQTGEFISREEINKILKE